MINLTHGMRVKNTVNGLHAHIEISVRFNVLAQGANAFPTRWLLVYDTGKQEVYSRGDLEKMFEDGTLTPRR